MAGYLISSAAALAPLWSQLITPAPATEETEEIQGGTYASFIDIDNEREKYAYNHQISISRILWKVTLRTSGRLTPNLPSGQAENAEMPTGEDSCFSDSAFSTADGQSQAIDKQSQEIDDLAEFDPEYRVVAWHGTMQVLPGP